ncbi:ABC transporter substrate-binding protein [Cognatishimia activa]|uniref:ABC transporter, substrate-binding protein, aliphatic sulfonates family n=1 Tax=Cognatishimia activa TaxID=1715691 RepID=A0A0P1IUD3_9RHOB|nr:ABC transporter substrate-binding protein [Cognatishimia activa]CUI47292.1 ABC transporter, substrate-binding protein, aliphatic sulfonates family [Cognatishimia activa]CUK27262.1 ABC transporter, substrate-binding protein, aliphatic sulfonates family [Cognatishimia activa]
MKHLSRLARNAVGAATTLIFSAAMGSSAFAADQVKVGVFPVSSSLPYFVAKERGYFADEGIETEAATLIGGPALLGGLISGQIDVAANLVTIEGMNGNILKPGVATYIAVNGQNAEWQMEQFVVGADHPAKSIADLKGAKILSAPGPANLAMAKAVLAANGLKEGDYQLDQVDMGQHVGALQAGTFDAGYTLEPAGMISVNLGATRLLEAGIISTYVLGDSSANTFAAGAALSGEFIEERPDVAERFAKAWARAVDDIQNDTESVRKHLIENTFTSAEIAPVIPMVNYQMVSDLSDDDLGNFQKFIDFAHQEGILKETVDVKGFLKEY